VIENNVWQQFLSIANKEIGSRAVETWFKAIYIYRWDNTIKTAFLYTPNHFVKEWIYNHYLHDLELHLARLFCEPSIKVILQVEQKETKIIPAGIIETQKKIITSNKKNNYCSVLQNEYQFHSFIVDKKNEFAFLAAQAIIKKPGDLYSPLFICGNRGVGKTHLLHAIGNQYLAQNKESNVLCCSIDRFVNDFVQSIRTKSMEQFNKKYEKIDLLLMDDLQDIAHKEQSQEILCNIVNNFNGLKKQIVFSSISEPHSLNGITEKLRSRLTSGLVANLFPPTIETKKAIIKKKLEVEYNEFLPDELIAVIANQNFQGVRDIEGALIKLTALASLTQRAIDLELIQKVLFCQNSTTQSQLISEEKILQIIVEFYSLQSIMQLIDKKRNARITHIRHIAIYLIKKILKKSLREIAAIFGNRDHTTIKHAIDKIEKKLLFNKELQLEVESIENVLCNRHGK